MKHNPVTYSAAWVPDDDPHRPWDEASAVAVDWVDAESRRLGMKGVLVTNTKAGQADSGPLASFVRRSSAHNPA